MLSLAGSAVSIWAGWMLLTRLDILSSGLNVFDITAIRFGAGGYDPLADRSSTQSCPEPMACHQIVRNADERQFSAG